MAEDLGRRQSSTWPHRPRKRGRGSFKEIGHFENGERHGPFETYHRGKLVRTGQYERGKREGTWVDYVDYDVATCTAHWHQDRLDGLYEIAFKAAASNSSIFRRAG